MWEICRPYWQAFVSLHSSRDWFIGMSGGMPGGLRYSEISCYAKDHGYGSCPDDLDEFVYLVQRMDQAYLKHANDSRPPK